MKKARAMYIPAGGKKAVWGPIDQNVLPDGYPYKEGGGKIVDTEIALAMINSVQSGATFSGTDLLVEGKTYKVTASFYDFFDFYSVSGEFVATVEESEDGLYLGPWGYDSMKVWCRSSGNYELVNNGGDEIAGHITIEAPETIHPMAEEFLPELTSPNGTKYKLTVSDDGTLSAVAAE